jgi:hypothetical protein
VGQGPRRGQVRQHGETGLAGLLDEDGDGRLARLLGGDGLVAGLAHQHPQALDVALGDAVGGVQSQGDLVVLARLSELAELPQRLGQAVLGLGVGAHLQDLAVGVGRLRPAPVGRVRDRKLDQLALDPNGVAAGALFDLGENQG